MNPTAINQYSWFSGITSALRPQTDAPIRSGLAPMCTQSPGGLVSNADYDSEGLGRGRLPVFLTGGGVREESQAQS